MSCSYKYCASNSKQTLNQDKLADNALVSCQLCNQVRYCTIKCKDLDWNSFHKKDCTASYDMKRKISDLNVSISESVSTISQFRCLEDYEIVNLPGQKQQLGKGSYGCVKLIREKQSSQFYALKIMSKKSIFEYCSLDNLKREIKIQKQLRHPHITQLYHCFEDQQNVYLVLQYAQRGSLFDYLKRRSKFPEEEAFIYFFQTCLGIDYLHKKQIIHRDLKPENLLLDCEGNIKLCDFGWSAQSSSTQRTTFCGTIDYMAPEMLQNSPHDSRLDIWCLGVLLFELTHGHAPFQGKNDQEQCHTIMAGRKINFSQTISLECRDLVESILKQKPQDRNTMENIFRHPWMKKMQKHYKINIKQYIFQTDGNYSFKESFLNEPEDDQIQWQKNISPATGEFFISQPPQRKKSGEDTFRSQSANNNSGYYGYNKQNMAVKPNFQQLESNPYTNDYGNNYNTSSNPGLKYNQNYSNIDFNRTQRVSRVSQRNKIYNDVEKREIPEEEIGFFEQILVAFGCSNREKTTKQ